MTSWHIAAAVMALLGAIYLLDAADAAVCSWRAALSQSVFAGCFPKLSSEIVLF